MKVWTASTIAVLYGWNPANSCWVCGGIGMALTFDICFESLIISLLCNC